MDPQPDSKQKAFGMSILSVIGHSSIRKWAAPSAQQFNHVARNPRDAEGRLRSFDFDQPEMRRRSIYRFVFRTLPDPFMDSLDCPDSRN